MLALAIVAAGLGLRLWSLSFGLPEIVHVDENSYVTKRLMGFIRTGDMNPHFFLNPTGFNYLLYAETKALYLAGRVAGVFTDYRTDMLALWNSGGSPFFLLARLTSALLGSATIWVVYRTGTLLFRQRSAGVVAAALLAVSFLHVRNSHFGTNDVTMVFFLALAFLACVGVYRHGRWRDYVLCGLLSGVATGVKYSAALILVSLLLAHAMRLRHGAWRSWQPHARLGAAVACAALAFLATTPYAILDHRAFRGEFLAQRLKMERGPHFGQDLLPAWRFYAWGLELSLGRIGALALLPCCLVGLRRYGAAFLLLAAFPVAYLLYMSAGSYYFLRFLLPVLPFTALAIAGALVALGARIPSPRARAAALVALTAALGWQPARASVELDVVLGREDTRLAARKWIEENVASGATLYVEGYGPQTRLDGQDRIGSGRYTILPLDPDESLAHFREQGVEYFVVSSYVAERFYKDPQRHAAQRAFYRDLADEAMMVAAFDPFEPGAGGEFHLDEVYAPIEPSRHRRPGPTIRIYRLPRRASGDGARHDATNVILITLDALRADRLGSYGYGLETSPQLDALARESVVFEQAVTASTFTLPSHFSIMTGLYPPRHGVRTNTVYDLAGGLPPTLAQILRAHGHSTAAFVSGFTLHSIFKLTRGFDLYRAANEADPRANATADVTTDHAIAFLRSAATPFFLWVHYFDCHEPYAPPPPWRAKFAHPYDGEIAFLDDQVGRLLREVTRAGLLESSLVVVTADHGEALGDHGYEGHQATLFDPVARVPLIVRLPGKPRPGTRVRSQVRTVDIMPTILARLGIDSAGDLDGVDLGPLLAGGDAAEDRAAYVETPHFGDPRQWKRAVRFRGWKLIESIASGERQLYRLDTDPGEATDVLAQEPDAAALLAAHFDDGRIEARLTVEPPESVRERLRALGYGE